MGFRGIVQIGDQGGEQGIAMKMYGCKEREEWEERARSREEREREGCKRDKVRNWGISTGLGWDSRHGPRLMTLELN